MKVFVTMQGFPNYAGHFSSIPDLNKPLNIASKPLVRQEGCPDDQEDGKIQTCNLAAKLGHSQEETGEGKGDGD